MRSNRTVVIKLIGNTEEIVALLSEMRPYTRHDFSRPTSAKLTMTYPAFLDCMISFPAKLELTCISDSWLFHDEPG